MGFESWMEDTPEIHGLEMGEFPMVATHDSAATTFAFRAPDANAGWHSLASSWAAWIVRLLAAYTMLGTLISGWGVTQTLSVTQQLEAGVRVLDLRLYAFHPRGSPLSDGENNPVDQLGFGISHTFPTPHSLQSVLERDVLPFLARNTGEIVVVRLKEDTHTHTEWTASHPIMEFLCSRHLDRILASSTVTSSIPYAKLRGSTVHDLVLANQRILFLWEGSRTGLASHPHTLGHVVVGSPDVVFGHWDNVDVYDLKATMLHHRITSLASPPPPPHLAHSPPRLLRRRSVFTELNFCLTPSQSLISSRYLFWKRVSSSTPTFPDLHTLSSPVNTTLVPTLLSTHGPSLSANHTQSDGDGDRVDVSFLTFDFATPDLVSLVMNTLYPTVIS